MILHHMGDWYKDGVGMRLLLWSDGTPVVELHGERNGVVIEGEIRWPPDVAMDPVEFRLVNQAARGKGAEALELLDRLANQIVETLRERHG